jgi:hypothetical protein
MWEFLTTTKDSILGVLISSGTLAAFVAFIYQKASTWLKARKSMTEKRAAVEREGESYLALVRVLDTLHRLETSTGAVRALILRSHNSGGPISIADHTYTSVIHESCKDKERRVKQLWQRRPVDLEYARLLNRIDKESEVHLLIEEMGEGDLKDLYSSIHVAQSLVEKIGKTGKGMLYLSVNYAEATPISPGDRTQIKAASAYLQQLFEQHEHIFHLDFSR